MNLPNQITLFRIILTPIFLLVLLIPFPFHYLAAAAIFGLAGFSDFLDGHIARKHKLVTTFGKLIDPVADKLLTTAALLAFLHFGWCDIGLVLLVLAREFLVTSVRMVASAQGVVIAANVWGKVKTVSQIVAILVILVAAQAVESFRFLSFMRGAPFVWLSEILLWITCVFALFSGIRYVYEASKVIDFNMK